MTNDTIILLTRYPQAGKAKTRLIPHLGAEGAAELHRKMAEFTYNEAVSLGIQTEVHYLGATETEMKSWLGALNVNSVSSANNLPKPLFIPQVEGDLGAKMFEPINGFLTKNIGQNAPQNQGRQRRKAVLIGSDCPSNRRSNLRIAFELLDSADCVLGPSCDGGYYLIGCAADCTKSPEALANKFKPLFQNITWGTETVLVQTKAKIESQKLRAAYLPTLDDVDTIDDVPPRISVIIPTLNEEQNLGRLLANLPPAFEAEIIVVDGGSSDKTLEVASAYSAIALSTKAGRAKQLSAGAQNATGDILFFLHADSILPPSWDTMIRQAMADPANSLGYFRFALTEKFWAKYSIEWTTRLRCKLLKLPYGDQGLFVRTKDFKTWDLPVVPILEDVFLVKKARENGKLAPLSATLYTSGRRWFKHGYIRTSVINGSVMAAAKLGLDLETIKQAYWQGRNPLLIWVQRLFKSR